MNFSQELVIILLSYAIKNFKKAFKKAGLPYGAESYVEIRGFLARYYDTLLDLATVGFYKNFMKDVISKMNIQPNDMILDMGAGTGRNDLLMLDYLE